jgi:radical SAM superfamily enzyme YgiQ (UPF0313 family)
VDESVKPDRLAAWLYTTAWNRSETVLKRLNKGIDLARVREVFKLTKKIGLDTLAYFMLGNPGETQVDIDRSLALAMEIQPDMLHLTIFTPFPATRLYQEALDSGLIREDVWRQFAFHPTPDFEPPIWESCTKRELQDIIVRSYKRFISGLNISGDGCSDRHFEFANLRRA